MLRIFFITLLTLVVSACSVKPATDYRTESDFSQYSTFAFTPALAGVPDSIDSARIREAVSHQLTQKGLRQADIDNAQLQVSYRIDNESELEPIGTSTSFGFSRSRSSIALSTPTQYYERRYGKLVLELLDRESQAILWRSISQKQLLQTMGGDKRNQFIHDEIAQMLMAYPPESK